MPVINNLVYQMLCLDPSSKTRCSDGTALLHAVRGFSSLWKKPRVDEKSLTISDDQVRFEVAEMHQPAGESNAAIPAIFGRAFLLTVTGPFKDVELCREPLAKFLKVQDFELVYVLKDEVSEHIACELYPFLYRVENMLRSYLNKFMSTRVDPKWWGRTASAEMSEKAKMRKRNETVFGKHVENSAYLIDFDELGELVFKQSSGFITQDDIVKRINACAETAEGIRKLKDELKTNYQKFFKESFADKEFKDKWEEFEGLRNKIAHGNLFAGYDLARGKQLANEIMEIISHADSQTDALVITAKERVAIQETVFQGGYPWKGIPESDFLASLNEQERDFEARGGFVGLAHFVKTILGEQGYDYRTSYELADRLKEEGKVEIYYIDNGQDEPKTAALRAAKLVR